MKDGTLAHFVPDRRERILDALAEFGEPQKSSLTCRLWGTVVIDGSRCISCRMCATFCPTGAIVKFDEAGIGLGTDVVVGAGLDADAGASASVSAIASMGVDHFPADCVKCGSCRDICPGNAIVLLDDVKTRYLVEGTRHRYAMTPRPVSLRNNPHQILDTMRQGFDGNLFER